MTKQSVLKRSGSAAPGQKSSSQSKCINPWQSFQNVLRCLFGLVCDTPYLILVLIHFQFWIRHLQSVHIICTTVLFCLYESTYLFLEITCFITNITVRLNFLFPTLFSKFVCFRIIDNCTIRRSTWRLNNPSKASRIIFVGFSKCLQRRTVTSTWTEQI